MQSRSYSTGSLAQSTSVFHALIPNQSVPCQRATHQVLMDTVPSSSSMHAAPALAAACRTATSGHATYATTRRTARWCQRHEACGVAHVCSVSPCAAVAMGRCAALPGQLLHPGPWKRSQASGLKRQRGASVVVAVSNEAQSGATPPQPSILQQLAKFADAQVLPLALLSMMAVGAAAPAWGCAAAKAGLAKYITIAIFVVAGLQLRRGEALTALRAGGCVAYGMCSILLLSPLLMVPALLALPIEPRALALGTAVFACMPTTLSAGISMTTASGGNTALAILLTVASNLGGVFTMPWVMPAVLGATVGGGLKPVELLAQLVETVLLPTLVGAAVRAYVPGVAAAIDGNKRKVVYFSAACLSTVPWMQVSKAAAGGMPLGAGAIALAMALGAGLHAALLAMNGCAARVLRLGEGMGIVECAKLRQALILQTSQKTLPVAIAVLSSPGMEPALGAGGAGVAAISAVAGHLSQTLIDSLMVPWWTAYIQCARDTAQQQGSQAADGGAEPQPA